MGLNVREIALDTLSISPQNVRKDPGDLTGLIDSILAVGVLEPIVVRPMEEGYEVIAGSRRTEAARRAGLRTIPASVVELTAVQAIVTSLIENIQRKDLTLEERVLTYQALQRLEPDYHNLHRLGKAIALSHQKISQDFQAYEMHLKLQPNGIRVASDLPPTDEERQQGLVLPEYHAVLLHQAMAYLPEEDADTHLAKLIAPLPQAEAKTVIEAVKDGQEHHSEHAEEDTTLPWHITPGRHLASSRSNATTKRGHAGGVVTCAYCEQEVSLIHLSDSRHRVKRSTIHLPNQ
jgi:ParB/RepB/Spo0J family partition protein